MKTPLAIAIGVALAATFGGATAANADASPFAMTALGSGYLAADAGEGKCGEGKCGGAKGGDKDMFASMDKNSDGEIDMAEHASYWDGKFETWDQNMDDQLTESEFEAAMKMRHKDKGHKDKGMDSGGMDDMDDMDGGGKGGGDKGGDKHKMLSDKMDTNESASVDRTEFTAYWDAEFRAVDANDDGAVTESEMQEWHDTKEMDGGTKSADTKTFLKDAGVGGMAEVEMAELALDKAESEEVRELAQHIVDDHTAANEKLAAIADDKGVEIPSALDRKHEEMKQELAELSGDEFDQQYVQAQVKAHEKMIDMFERQANEGQDEEVKEFASVTLPALEEHLEMAEELSAQLDR